MPAQRFLIAPLVGGLVSAVKPWMIPEDAFEQLRNMYVFRGRLRKRFGSKLMVDNNDPVDPAELFTAQLASRLRINIGTTAAVSGDFASAIPLVAGLVTADYTVGMMFSIGTTLFNVTTIAAGAQATLTTGAATATFNVTTGQLLVTGNGENPSTAVFFYPALPVTGITENNTDIIEADPTYAFDTRFAYVYTGGGWDRLGTAIWKGASENLFWTAVWYPVLNNATYLFATNFYFATGIASTSDPMRYWDGAAWQDYTPNYLPDSGGTSFKLFTARIVLGFQNRLIWMNVIKVETTGGVGTLTQFSNEIWFSVYNDALTTATSFNHPNNANLLILPTDEQILSAQLLKNRCIIFCENSTWELVYTGNEIEPFRVQKINTELGVTSTFSVVPFDQVVLGIGNVGIHACNGASVKRIDSQIPDFIFSFQQNDPEVKRVWGIRDYKVEQVYWTFTGVGATTTFPDKVLVFNYATGTWALNDDSITAFGYFQNQTGLTWQTWDWPWETSDNPWNDGAGYVSEQVILAGNQEGFMFIIDSGVYRNAGVLQITNITGANLDTLTIKNHNLQQGDYIALENLLGTTYSADPAIIVLVLSVIDADTIVIDAIGTGTYLGGGTVARVSNPQILTKMYNFFNEVGTNIAVDKIDFLVDKTTNGEISVQTLASSSSLVLNTQVLETRPYPTNLYPLEATQDRVWHSLYPNLNGETAQLNMTFTEDQIRDTSIAWSAIEIHAFMFYVGNTSSRFE